MIHLNKEVGHSKDREAVAMKEVGLALLAGFIVGAVFAVFKLPIPAPPALAGIAGIIGIYLGFKFIGWVAPMLASVFN